MVILARPLARTALVGLPWAAFSLLPGCGWTGNPLSTVEALASRIDSLFVAAQQPDSSSFDWYPSTITGWESYEIELDEPLKPGQSEFTGDEVIAALIPRGWLAWRPNIQEFPRWGDWLPREISCTGDEPT